MYHGLWSIICCTDVDTNQPIAPSILLNICDYGPWSLISLISYSIENIRFYAWVDYAVLFQAFSARFYMYIEQVVMGCITVTWCYRAMPMW